MITEDEERMAYELLLKENTRLEREQNEVQKFTQEVINSLKQDYEVLRNRLDERTRERDAARMKANQWEQSCFDCRRHDIEKRLKQIIDAPQGEKLHAAIHEARGWMEAQKNMNEPDLSQKIDALMNVQSLERENARLRSMGAVAMMCENENVKHHISDWENRCLKAEKEVDRLSCELDEARKALAAITLNRETRAVLTDERDAALKVCSIMANEIRNAVEHLQFAMKHVSDENQPKAIGILQVEVRKS